MVTSELEKVHLSNGGRSRTAAACSGVEFQNGSQLLYMTGLLYKASVKKLPSLEACSELMSCSIGLRFQRMQVQKQRPCTWNMASYSDPVIYSLA